MIFAFFGLFCFGLVCAVRNVFAHPKRQRLCVHHYLSAAFRKQSCAPVDLVMFVCLCVCLQGLRVGGPLSLAQARKVNVEPGCSVPDPCSSNPCPVNSYCSDNWDSYSCTCLAGQSPHNDQTIKNWIKHPAGKWKFKSQIKLGNMLYYTIVATIWYAMLATVWWQS